LSNGLYTSALQKNCLRFAIKQGYDGAALYYYSASLVGIFIQCKAATHPLEETLAMINLDKPNSPTQS